MKITLIILATIVILFLIPFFTIIALFGIPFFTIYSIFTLFKSGEKPKEKTPSFFDFAIKHTKKNVHDKSTLCNTH